MLKRHKLLRRIRELLLPELEGEAKAKEKAVRFLEASNELDEALIKFISFYFFPQLCSLISAFHFQNSKCK